MTQRDQQPQIWTIGHWVCSQEAFVHALQSVDIQLLVDVRAQPGSRRSPQFSIDALPGWLDAAGIGYQHLPELAGRRPKQPEIPPHLNQGWRNQSFKNYADYSLTPAYERGLAQLQDWARMQRVCMLCGEPMPWRCHRSLIANSLSARGWQVWHLSTTAKPRLHELGAWGAMPHDDGQAKLTYPAEKQTS